MTPLKDSTRIVVNDADLIPLARLLSEELPDLSGLPVPEIATSPRDGDIILKKNNSLKADESRIESAQKTLVEVDSYQAIANGTATDKILGAQLCSWEQAEETEIGQLRHPLPAMAERIWNRDHRDYDGFLKRLAGTDRILNTLLAKTPPSPVNPTASDSVYADGVMIRWRASKGHPSHYRVLRSADDSLDSAKVIADDLTDLEYFDRKITPGTRYAYWVEAENHQGRSKQGKKALGAAGTATKLPQAYEGFDYPAGQSVADKNGGSGWASPWSFKTEGPASIKKQGLTYKGLPTRGGCLNVRMSMKEADGKTLLLSRNTKNELGIPGADFWMSFLMRANKLGEGHCFLKNTGKAWMNGLGVHTRNSGHPIKEGQTVLLVAHYACLDGKDVIRMWVNPDLGETPPADSQDMAFCDAVDIGSSSEILLNVQPHGDGDYDFDEIRIGSSWNEVIGNSPR
jgi:hypothetical protein